MLTSQKQLSSVLVKPAGPDCNMACTYCFYLEKAELFSGTKKHRMSEEILEEMVSCRFHNRMRPRTIPWLVLLPAFHERNP